MNRSYCTDSEFAVFFFFVVTRESPDQLLTVPRGGASTAAIHHRMLLQASQKSYNVAKRVPHLFIMSRDQERSISRQRARQSRIS